jgi:hypothetical protein
MKNKSFANPLLTKQSGKVGLDVSASVGSAGIDYPIFCFRHLHGNYNFENCLSADRKFIKGFVQKLKNLSDAPWHQIQFSDKHGIGSEKIAKSSIQASIPSSITKDVTDFLSFYFAGAKGRIIGYRSGVIFHVIYIDTNLSVYNH